MHGIKLHRNFAQGSDGSLGNDFVEIKTITPFNTHDRVSVRLDRHFNKLLVVKVDASFRVEGRLVPGEDLKKTKGKSLTLTWGELQAAPLSMSTASAAPVEVARVAAILVHRPGREHGGAEVPSIGKCALPDEPAVSVDVPARAAERLSRDQAPERIRRGASCRPHPVQARRCPRAERAAGSS